jgi:hypothetical protein
VPALPIPYTQEEWDVHAAAYEASKVEDAEQPDPVPTPQDSPQDAPPARAENVWEQEVPAEPESSTATTKTAAAKRTTKQTGDRVTTRKATPAKKSATKPKKEAK